MCLKGGFIALCSCLGGRDFFFLNFISTFLCFSAQLRAVQAAGPPCSPCLPCCSAGSQGCGCGRKPSATRPSRAAVCERCRWLTRSRWSGAARGTLLLCTTGWEVGPWAAPEQQQGDISLLPGLFVNNRAAGSMSPASQHRCAARGRPLHVLLAAPLRVAGLASLLPLTSRYLT